MNEKYILNGKSNHPDNDMKSINDNYETVL